MTKYKFRFKKERVLKLLGGTKKTGEYLGVSSQAVSMWPKGKDVPRIHQLALVIKMPDHFPRA